MPFFKNIAESVDITKTYINAIAYLSYTDFCEELRLIERLLSTGETKTLANIETAYHLSYELNEDCSLSVADPKENYTEIREVNLFIEALRSYTGYKDKMAYLESQSTDIDQSLDSVLVASVTAWMEAVTKYVNTDLINDHAVPIVYRNPIGLPVKETMDVRVFDAVKFNSHVKSAIELFTYDVDFVTFIINSNDDIYIQLPDEALLFVCNWNIFSVNDFFTEVAILTVMTVSAIEQYKAKLETEDNSASEM